MRFVKEYANYKKRRIGKLTETVVDKDEAIKEIDKTLKLFNLGLITVDECMRTISNIEAW